MKKHPLLAAGAAAGTAVLGAAYAVYRVAFYQKPTTKVPSPADMPTRECYRKAMGPDADALARDMFKAVHITAQDGTPLAARYYHHADGAPLAIIFHGYRGYAERDGLGAILFGHFDPEDADCEAAAAQSKVPILFVHGDADGFVPYDMGKRNYEACRAKGKKFLTVHGAEHAVSYYHDNDAYTKQATEFLQDCLARRGFVWPPETDEPEK